MSLTKLPPDRNNSVMTSLFPPWEFGSDIPAGDGKLANLFFTVYSQAGTVVMRLYVQANSTFQANGKLKKYID
jgi:hypothetical protein